MCGRAFIVQSPWDLEVLLMSAVGQFFLESYAVRMRGGYLRCQAQYLRRAYEHLARWSYVKVGVWFKLKDTTSDRGNRNDNFGLLRYDGSEKPAFAAFRGAAWRLSHGAGRPVHIKLKVF